MSKNPDDKYLLPFLALIVGTENNKGNSNFNGCGCVITIALVLLTVLCLIAPYLGN